MITRLRIPSFLVTLGMLSVLRGLALTFTGSLPVPIVDDGFVAVLSSGTLFSIPASILWTIVTIIVGFYLLHLTVFGRRTFATGGNALAARFSGIDTRRITVLAFTISGVTAAFAVIIGGTSLFGGRGNVLGSVAGAIFIGALGFGLVVMGLSTSIQEVVKGIIIVAAVSLNRR